MGTFFIFLGAISDWIERGIPAMARSGGSTGALGKLRITTSTENSI